MNYDKSFKNPNFAPVRGSRGRGRGGRGQFQNRQSFGKTANLNEMKNEDEEDASQQVNALQLDGDDTAGEEEYSYSFLPMEQENVIEENGNANLWQMIEDDAEKKMPVKMESELRQFLKPVVSEITHEGATKNMKARPIWRCVLGKAWNAVTAPWKQEDEKLEA